MTILPILVLISQSLTIDSMNIVSKDSVINILQGQLNGQITANRELSDSGNATKNRLDSVVRENEARKKKSTEESKKNYAQVESQIIFIKSFNKSVTSRRKVISSKEFINNIAEIRNIRVSLGKPHTYKTWNDLKRLVGLNKSDNFQDLLEKLARSVTDRERTSVMKEFSLSTALISETVAKLALVEKGIDKINSEISNCDTISTIDVNKIIQNLSHQEIVDLFFEKREFISNKNISLKSSLERIHDDINDILIHVTESADLPVKAEVQERLIKYKTITQSLLVSISKTK